MVPGKNDDEGRGTLREQRTGTVPILMHMGFILHIIKQCDFFSKYSLISSESKILSPGFSLDEISPNIEKAMCSTLIGHR
jgi:hypothetical protein